MANALRECWHRAASGVPLFGYDDVHRWSHEEFEALVSLGVLRETVQAREVMCDSCAEAHWEEVIWKRSVRTASGLQGYIACPVEMFVPVAPERLRQWAVDTGTVARLIAAGMELSGGVEEKYGGLWWIGRRRLAGRFRDFFLAVKPASLAPDLALSYAAPVILAAHGHAEWKDSGIPAFLLPDVLSLASDRIVVDLNYIEDALPRERGAEKSQTLRSLPLPDGTSWSDITIEVGDTSLAISANGFRKDLGFEEAGFADMRQGDLTGDRALQTLRLFATGRGRFAPRKIAAAAEEKTPFKKYVSLLRQRLKGLLPVEGEPIVFEKTSGVYRCAFSLFLESDGGYPTPAGATWQDFRFEELPGGRLRVGVRAREVFQARTTSRGSERPSSEPAQREAWSWREYPLERLQLTNSQGMPSSEGLVLLALIRAGGRLQRRAGDMNVLRLGRRLREWTGLSDEPFRFDGSEALWIAQFECGNAMQTKR